MSERLPHEKGFHVSWDQLHRDARALAWRLDGKGPKNGAWKAVVAITRGGMAPAMIVARELDIRTVDTISVKSYDHQSQSEPQIIKSPNSELIGDGTGILIIDDLVATGGTAEAAAKLIKISKGSVSGFIFVINLFDLGGCNKLIKSGYKVENLIEFPGH